MQQPSPLAFLGPAFRARTPVFSAWVGTTDPAIVEALLSAGFDAALLDAQHGGFELSTASSGIAHCAIFGKPAIVRIPVSEFAMASRLLDAGAAAIVAPMINSAEDARRLVNYTKFPPIGQRSWGPRRATVLSGLTGLDYLRKSNGLQLIIAMIETKEALDNLDAILAVSGIDGIFVGPSDLSIGLSNGSNVDPSSPEVDAALRHIVDRAKAVGKVSGLFCFSGARAKVMAERGFGLLTVATELLLLNTAARSELAAAR